MTKTAAEMLCDIGIYPEIDLPDDAMSHLVGADEREYDDYSPRQRLERRGLDVDHTAVDTFMSNPDWGLCLADDD